MTLLQRSPSDVREQTLTLARIGLEHQVRPIRDSHSSATNRLFELDNEYRGRSAALRRFEAAFQATPSTELGPGDARIYRRERERRHRQIQQLEKGREALLESYAEELLASPRQHPALQHIYADLGVEF